MKNIHRLISDLRPTLLDDLGLEPAIAWYGEQRLKPLGITLKMTGNSLRERLPPAIETPLFRIVQEAITNVIRHANATVVKVSLLRQANEVTLQISDNGRGFDHAILHSADPHGKGLGLRGMQERAGILGGEFQLETSATGTTITIRVPLSN